MKKYWKVGYGYRYTEYREEWEIVYGTKRQAKDYILEQLRKQPEWLQKDVGTKFNVKNQSCCLKIEEQKIITL